MDNSKIQNLDCLTVELDCSLSILNSAVKADEGLTICELEDFISQIYQKSQEIRQIFNN